MGLHGYVPMPMIENLVHSRVLKARRKGGGGGYCVRNLSGSENMFRAVSIEHKFKFIESSASKPFKARLCQRVR